MIGISVVMTLSSCKEEQRKITFNDLPFVSQEFLSAHFPNEVVSYIMEDDEMFDKTYEVRFIDGDNVDFDAEGVWDNVDCHNVCDRRNNEWNIECGTDRLRYCIVLGCDEPCTKDHRTEANCKKESVNLIYERLTVAHRKTFLKKPSLFGLLSR